MTSKCFARTSDAIPEVRRRELIDGVVTSEFFGGSVLGPEFVATDGFSIVFQRRGLDSVTCRFPYLKELFRVALFESCNAFYVNPLVMYRGSRVDPHVDCRLMPCGNIRIIPNLVSVYYAEIPIEMAGGALLFYPGSIDEFKLTPCSGDLVHFRGSAIHCVEPLSVGKRRISVVCEQYNLEESLLEAFPYCDLIASDSEQMRLNGLTRG